MPCRTKGRSTQVSQCDRSGMYPLVGPRFNVGNDDVCESQLNKLKENERYKYTRIEPPKYVKLDEKQWGCCRVWSRSPWTIRSSVRQACVSRQCAKSGALNYQ